MMHFMENLTINFGSDHRGFGLKSLLISRLRKAGHTVNDFGPDNETRCDAGDFALRVVEDMRAHPARMGILICGSGQVMAMTANRFKHIRAALCLNTTMARLAREHNDANVLVMGAHIIGEEIARDCVDVFMSTKFLGGRYGERVEKLTAMGGL